MKRSFAKFLSTSALLGAVCFGGISSAYAAGFFVQEQSVSSVGASFAGSGVNHNDASVMFFNPSGIAHLDGRQLNVGTHALYTHTELNDLGTEFVTTAAVGGGDGGNPGGLNIIPNFYVATPVTDNNNTWIGIGVAAPFGLGVDYNDDVFSRFLIREVKLKTVDVLPTVAHKVSDSLTLGASAIFQKADINAQLDVPAGAPPASDFLRATADDLAIGYQFGLTYEPTDDLTLGLSYRSRVNINFRGDVNANVVTGAAEGASGQLNLPDIANLSASYDLDDQWTLLATVSWFGWGNTDNLTLTTDDGDTLGFGFAYEDTLNFNLGFEYQYSDDLLLRAGYQFDNTPTTIEERSTINPDGNRHWFSVGGSYLYDSAWSIDTSLTYIDIADGNISKNSAGDFTTVEAQAQDSYAINFGIAVNYKF